MQVHKPASADNNRADIIFLREYQYGLMSNETVLRMADKDAHRKAIKKDRSETLQPWFPLCLLCLILHLKLVLLKHGCLCPSECNACTTAVGTPLWP